MTAISLPAAPAKKLTVLYLLDCIGLGGSENLVVNTINATARKYNNILVYLHEPHSLIDKIEGAEVICLNTKGKASLPMAALKLRRILQSRKVDIVTAHSYWTSILSRMAVPRRIALINTYHFADYETKHEMPSCRQMIRLDKLTYRKGMHLVSVSAYVQSVLEKYCGYTENLQTIVNFISEDYQSTGSSASATGWQPQQPLRLIAVGSTKPEKNYELLVAAFAQLKELPVYLEVYGGGNQVEHYRQLTKAAGITNLVFQGQSSNLPALLPTYDAYISSSFSEACPLSPIQALSCGLPVILSAIPAHQEIAQEEALYFENGNAEALAALLKNVLAGRQPLKYEPAFVAARLQHYSRESNISALSQLYEWAVSSA